jgi:hypothetical protein
MSRVQFEVTSEIQVFLFSRLLCIEIIEGGATPTYNKRLVKTRVFDLVGVGHNCDALRRILNSVYHTFQRLQNYTSWTEIIRSQPPFNSYRTKSVDMNTHATL